MTAPVDRRLAQAYRQLVADIERPTGTAPPDVYIKPIVPRIVMDTIREYLDMRVQRDIKRKAEHTAPSHH
jgi:hypothetical protein